MKQQNKLEEESSIEPGWDYEKKEMTKMHKFESPYKPIEPDPGFPNPYRVILKHFVKKIKGEGKEITGLLELFATAMILPGLFVYTGIKGKDILKEGGFKPIEDYKEFKYLCFAIEGTKIPLGAEIYKIFS